MDKIKSFTACSKCGKKKFARQEIIKKRLAKGSIENWVCRECKKETFKKTESGLEQEPILTNEEDDDFFAK